MQYKIFTNSCVKIEIFSRLLITAIIRLLSEFLIAIVYFLYRMYNYDR